MEAQGDWDLRGRDWETVLVGPVTESVINADWQVRNGTGCRWDWDNEVFVPGPDAWSNGFPNWELYRVSIAGDDHLARKLADWCIAFAVAFMESGGVQKRTASDEFAVFVGWDCLTRLRTRHWIASGDDMAADLGIAPKTYRRFRNAVMARLSASLGEYWARLQIGIRQAALIDRRIEMVTPIVVMFDGTGYERGAMLGDGNFRAMPKGSGC